MAGTSSSIAADEEKDIVLDNLYWIKQVFALVIGLAVGYLKFKGFPILVAYGILISIVSTFYVWQVLKNDEIETWDIVSEAFGPAFFIFMLTWIISFTYF